MNNWDIWCNEFCSQLRFYKLHIVEPKDQRDKAAKDAFEAEDAFKALIEDHGSLREVKYNLLGE